MKQNLIIDTDCGMDDIIAIAMIVASDKFIIKGITTVRGLVTPSKGKANLIKILQYLKTSVEIVSGARSPIIKSRLKYSFPSQDKINSTSITFLRNLLEKVDIKKQRCSACDFIYKKVGSSNDGITLLCLGPLTNIAKTIQEYKSEFTQNINQIIIMGGAVYTYGNVPPSKLAEYNIYLDPEAAEIVFKCGIPIKLVSIDSTNFVPATVKIKKQIEKYKAKTRCGEIIKKTIIANKNDFNYFYDPLAAGILINPEIVLKTKKVGIDVSKNEVNTGQTSPVLYQNCVEVITKASAKKFKETLLETLK